MFSAWLALIKIGVYLYHLYGVLGILAMFLTVPLFVAPVAEWISTGSPWTFILLYVFFFGSVAWLKLLNYSD